MGILGTVSKLAAKGAGIALETPLLGEQLSKSAANLVNNSVRRYSGRASAVLEAQTDELIQEPDGEFLSEEILFQTIRPFLDSVREILAMIDEDPKLGLKETVIATRERLETQVLTDENLKERVKNVEDPIARLLLRLMLRNKERFLRLLKFLEENEFETTSEVIRSTPELLRRSASREQEIAREVMELEEGRLSANLIKLAREVLHACRETDIETS